MAIAVKRGDSELMVSATPWKVKEVSAEDRILRFIGSDETPDRDRDIIEVNGWDMKNFKMNPVFLWAHDYRTPPIGRAVKVFKAEDKLIFDIKFPDEGIYPFADLIYNLYKGGFMSATSVGFIPKAGKPRDDEEVKDLPEWQRGRRYSKQELLELSAVPVPSNPSAVQVARDKGYVSEEQENALKLFMDGKFQSGVNPMTAFKGLEGIMKAGQEDGTLFEASTEVDIEIDEKSAEVLFDAEAKSVKGGEEEVKEEGKITPVPVKILTQLKQVKSWECPHCVKAIGEKELFNDGTHFYHSPCKEAGPIVLPSDEEMKTVDVSYAQVGPVSVDVEKCLVSIDIPGIGARSYSFEFLKELDVTAVQKAGAVLSKKNKDLLYNAVESIEAVLVASGVPEEPEGGGNDDDDKVAPASNPATTPDTGTVEPVKDAPEGEQKGADGEEDIKFDFEISPEHREIDLSGLSADDVKSLISETLKEELNAAKGLA